MSADSDRFKTRFDAHDDRSAIEILGEKLLAIESDYEGAGRRAVYRAMRDEGISNAIIQRIKSKFND